MAAANATINHDEIRSWVEERGGSPARVKRTGRGGDPGILRIDYPEFTGKETLQKISWDEWFDWFEENNLAFLHQDTIGRGNPSRFSKLVDRSTVDVEGGRGARKTTARGRGRAATARRGLPTVGQQEC